MMMVMSACPLVDAPMDNYALLKNKQQTSPWGIHQSEAVAKRGKCGWEDCPGKLASKAAYPCSSDSCMHCEECSVCLGKDVYLYAMALTGECRSIATNTTTSIITTSKTNQRW